MTITTEDALAHIVRQATGPLSVRGGDTRGMTGAGIPLDVSGLSGVTLYEPGALTMVAQAGTPIAKIEETLARENQRLAFEPMDHRALLGTKGTPTIGGVFAANISGPRRIAVGAARDFLLGVRFVDGQGRVIKNGGRVMKNVTGYDLVKLMAGSFGRLGILSEVSFKVLPMPETQGSLVMHGLDDTRAVAVLSRAMASPFEVTGAAHDATTNQTVLRVEGFESSVVYRVDALRKLLKDDASQMDVLDQTASTAFWKGHKDVAAFAAVDGDVWRVSSKPSDAPALVQKADAKAVLYDWAGGLIWVRTAAGSDLRAGLGVFDGHATLVRASAETRANVSMFHPETAGMARLTARLRARFDPRGIFNADLSEMSQ